MQIVYFVDLSNTTSLLIRIPYTINDINLLTKMPRVYATFDDVYVQFNYDVIVQIYLDMFEIF